MHPGCHCGEHGGIAARIAMIGFPPWPTATTVPIGTSSLFYGFLGQIYYTSRYFCRVGPFNDHDGEDFFL